MNALGAWGSRRAEYKGEEEGEQSGGKLELAVTGCKENKSPAHGDVL